jgi:hypothetical protein
VARWRGLVGVRGTAVNQQRQDDIFGGREGGQQVEKLEDEANLSPPHNGNFVVAEMGQATAVEDDLPVATVSRPPSKVSAVYADQRLVECLWHAV